MWFPAEVPPRHEERQRQYGADDHERENYVEELVIHAVGEMSVCWWSPYCRLSVRADLTWRTDRTSCNRLPPHLGLKAQQCDWSEADNVLLAAVDEVARSL